MANEPGYYKQLLETLLKTPTPPAWISEITPTATGSVATFHNLNYPVELDNHKRLKVNRIVFDVSSGLIRVYFSLDSNGTVTADKNLVGLDSALIPLFKQVFAPYDIGDIHRSKVSEFVRNDAHEVFVTYVSYYLSGQIESAWFEYLQGMDYETQLSAVKSDPDYIRYIDDPDDALQMAAVQQDPYTIQWIEHPTDAVQIAAIRKSPATLVHIKNPTVLSQSGIKIIIMRYLIERLKINAKYHSAEIVAYLRKHGVQWPDLAVIEQSLNAGKLTETLKLSDLNTASEKRQLTAVKKDGERIQYISNPSEAVQLAAVQQDGGAIFQIENPSLAVQLAAVQQNGLAIQYIENLSPELLADTQAKQSIIKYILLSMKQNRLATAKVIVTKLRTHNVDWPELDVIEQSLLPDKQG